MYNGLFYIFFVGDIHGVGGAELYLKKMSKWLKNNGADVAIVHSGIPFGQSDVPELNEYITTGNKVFGEYMPEQLDRKNVLAMKLLHYFITE